MCFALIYGNYATGEPEDCRAMFSKYDDCDKVGKFFTSENVDYDYYYILKVCRD